MKARFLLSFCILAGHIALKGQQTVYAKTIANVNASYLLPDGNNGSIIIGETPFISKLNDVGNVLWTKQYLVATPTGTWTRPIFTAALRDQDSNIVVTGATHQVTNDAIGFCIKFDKNGDTLWSKQLIDSNYVSFIPREVALCKDTGYIICGSAIPVYPIAEQMFAAKFTKHGNLTWLKTYNTANFQSKANSIHPLPDSGYVFSGSIFVNSNPDIVIGRLSNNGQIVWTKEINYSSSSSYGDEIIMQNSGFTLLSNGNFFGVLDFSFNGNLIHSLYLTNVFESRSNSFLNDSRFFKLKNNHYLILNKGVLNPSTQTIIEVDTSGKVHWARSIKGRNIDAKQNKDKTIDLMSNNDLYSSDFQLIRLDTAGNSVGACMYEEFPMSSLKPAISISPITFTANSVGYVSSFQPTIMPITLDSKTGCFEVVQSLKDQALTPFKLFPNPATDKLSIHSEKLVSEDLRLSLVNLSGICVYTSTLKPNESTWTFKLPELPPGFYIYQIEDQHRIIQIGKQLIQSHR